MPVESKLLEMLRCPACPERPPVREEGEELVCTSCGRRYPVEDGIPHMIVEELDGSVEPGSLEATGPS